MLILDCFAPLFKNQFYLAPPPLQVLFRGVLGRLQVGGGPGLVENASLHDGVVVVTHSFALKGILWHEQLSEAIRCLVLSFLQHGWHPKLAFGRL